jgi:hypothetical protein
MVRTDTPSNKHQTEREFFASGEKNLDELKVEKMAYNF